MKFRGILALALMLGCAPAIAQVTPGTSPLTGPKGGTNNAFMQFAGPASALKTYTLPNVSGTLAMLSQIQTWTGAQTFSGGINTTIIAPIADSTTALRINNFAQTHNIVTFDTINFRVGINKNPGAFDLDVNGAANIGGALSMAGGGSLAGTFTGTPTFSGANFLTLANIVQDASAWSFLGNASGGTANYAPFTVGGLTNKATPAGADTFIIADSAAAGALKQITLTAAIGAVGSGVTSLNAQTGAVVLWPFPQGRLTLTSGTPVMATSVAAATTVFYTSYAGKNVPIPNGTAVAVYQLCAANTAGACEQSVALGSNWATNSNYDFFEGLNSGTPTLCSGPAWTSDTARGTGAGTTELQQLDGLNANKNTMTCRFNNTTTFSCAANQCTYLGTMRTGAAGQTNFIYGASAAGGTAGLFGIWNAYNRIQIKTTVTDSTANFTPYSSATIAALDGSNGNRVSFVNGLAEDGIAAQLEARVQLSTGFLYRIGFALDATNALDKQALTTGGTSFQASQTVRNNYAAQLGFHFIQATQQGDGTNAVTVSGNTDEGLFVDMSM